MPSARSALGAPGGALVLALAAASGGAQTDHDPPHCLAMAIYWESKGCGRDDIAAVGAVILNRLAHPEFPDDICAVVQEGGERPPCQFSWWCDDKGDAPDEAEPWALAREVAARLLEEPLSDPTGGALFFHSNEIDSPWAVARERTAQIGCHAFYR